MAKEVEGKFEVRTITESSAADLKKYFLDTLEKEHWMPGADDVELLLAINPTSIYVGELNGKPIAITCTFKYEDKCRHFGNYLVEKRYRAQGYGLKLLAEAKRQHETDPVDIIYSFYSVPEMVDNYKKMYNAESHWPIEMRIVDIPKAIALLTDNSGTTNSVFEIKRVTEVDMQALYGYDTKIFGYEREKFLQRLVQVGHTRLAVNQQQQIVGYAVARLLYNPDGGYKVGPVFAESFEIAKYLLKELFQEIVESGISSKKTVVINFVDPDTNELAKFLGGELIIKSLYLTVNGLPRSDFKKWFAVTFLVAG